MADILQTAFQMHFHEKKTTFALQLKYIPLGIVGKKSALDELMAQYLTATSHNLNRR